MYRTVICALMAIFVAASCSTQPAQSNVELKKTDKASIEVYIKGNLFTAYHYGLGFEKPIFYPLISAGGNWLNRAWPMRFDVPGEARDHWHQESFWFTYGNVNGVDLWAKTPETGKIRHTGFTAMESGDRQGVLGYTADWIEPGGKTILKQETTVIFGFTEMSRTMDFDMTLTAMAEQVVFGDTKEGMFGIRYHHDLHEENGGMYINENGQEKEAGPNGVWGKRAGWVALRGKVAGEPVVIAILEHPTSVNHPTWWHARGYGLFAVNPFGRKDFEAGSEPMNVTIKQGESLRFRYHVIFYSGTFSKEELDGIYASYKGEK